MSNEDTAALVERVRAQMIEAKENEMGEERETVYSMGECPDCEDGSLCEHEDGTITCDRCCHTEYPVRESTDAPRW